VPRSELFPSTYRAPSVSRVPDQIYKIYSGQPSIEKWKVNAAWSHRISIGFSASLTSSATRCKWRPRHLHRVERGSQTFKEPSAVKAFALVRFALGANEAFPSGSRFVCRAQLVCRAQPTCHGFSETRSSGDAYVRTDHGLALAPDAARAGRSVLSALHRSWTGDSVRFRLVRCTR